MSDEFGFGAGAAVADTAVPADTLPDGMPTAGDFQFDESEGGGKFPPRILPGPVTFQIEVMEAREKDNSTDPAKASTHVLANGKVPLLVYTAHVNVATLGTARLVRPDKDGAQTELAVRFNEASGFKSAKMAEKHVSSDVERLYTAMGLVSDAGKPTSVDQMVQTIRNAGRRTVSGKLGWSAAIKLPSGGYEVYSTDPNAKRGDKPWPRNDDGTLPTEITFSTGDTRIAREEIVAVYPPKKAKV